MSQLPPPSGSLWANKNPTNISLPLRDDVDVEFRNLPRNLTEKEADAVVEMIRTLVQPQTIRPIDPNVAPADAPRLSQQSLDVLNRLRRGRASNRELSAIALKYTSRISDIRAAGYEIECSERVGGLCFYSLKGKS